MDQPYLLAKDSRDGVVWRIPADRQSKTAVPADLVPLEQLDMRRRGYDPSIFDANAAPFHDYLDSLPG